MITTQFTLYLENKPGALFAVAERLAEAGINIEAISVAASTDVGLCQLVTSEVDQTRDSLRAQHVAFTEQPVLVVQIPDKVGSLARGLGRIAKSGVNINYVYATTPPQDGAARECSLVISAPDLEAVSQAWAE